MRDRPPFWVSLSAFAIRTAAVRPLPAGERARPVRGRALPRLACRATSAAPASSAISTTRSRAKCASRADTSRRKRSSSSGSSVPAWSSSTSAPTGATSRSCARTWSAGPGASSRSSLTRVSPRCSRRTSPPTACRRSRSTAWRPALHRSRKAFVGFDERDGNWGVSRAARGAEVAGLRVARPSPSMRFSTTCQARAASIS